MKRGLFLALGLLLTVAMVAQFNAASFSASGTFNDETKADVGLAKIYVFKSLVGATVSYTTSRSNTVNVYSYEDNYVSEPKVPVPLSNIDTTNIGIDQRKYTITKLQDSRGLVMDDNGQPKAVWIVDYSQHVPKLTSLTAEEGDDKCEVLKLVIDKSDVLQYRGTAGQLKEIVRAYDVSYDVYTWNEEEFVSEVYTEKNVPIVGTEIFLTKKVPNRNTKFTVSGDQFGKDFEIAHLSSVTTPNLYEAASVEAYISYKQEKREADNETGEKPTLGGSAPVYIEFTGHANKPVADHFTWFIFDKKDLKNPIARYADKDMNYSFEQYGDYVVRFEATNTRSQCMDSVSVNVNISDSFLDIPNYFSPRGTPGSNDVFKVAYRSLVKFKCTIFNRWGNKVYEWSDPAQGWDGRYKGTLVNPGVYYYVIEATGADGKKYKKGGDINIL